MSDWYAKRYVFETQLAFDRGILDWSAPRLPWRGLFRGVQDVPNLHESVNTWPEVVKFFSGERPTLTNIPLF